MADIFISYSSQDAQRAQALAEALGARGWSIWWDRKIPLGVSYDEVIEKALAQAKCAIVLWSAVSVASEWVRNEASEAKRRGILVPAFLERVEAPLAFRLLNGADLSAWRPGHANPEFDQLTERVTELLGQPVVVAASSTQPSYGSATARRSITRDWFRSPLVLVGSFIIVAAAAFSGNYFRGRGEPDPKKGTASFDGMTNTKNPLGSHEETDLEKRIKDLSGLLSGAIPASALAKGFYVPDLGLRIAYISAQQSASTFGSLPAGAVVMEVESGRPAGHAGLQVGDIVTTIGGQSITSEEDLRRAIFKIGPGKTA
ncbi:MAG TPA: TIR domain-containing protein, partial [Terriglobales bacterium]|nr:TIR domain-containing protein [Terriglobales bacterium]